MDFADLVQGRLEELGHNINSFEASRGWPQGFLRAVVRTDGKRTVPNIERAQTICDALGLEFYIGPPRLDIYPRPVKNPKDGEYSIIPYDSRDPTRLGRPPLAFSSLWLRKHEVDPKRMSVVVVPNDDMAPSMQPGDLLLIDGSFVPEREPTLCAFTADNQLKVGWLTAPEARALVGFFQRPYTPPVARVGRVGPLIECLGRIVVRLDEHVGPWIDAQEKRRLLDLADDIIRNRKSS